MFKSDAVITDSFHGSIFSIIFNKPFITIYDKFNAKERFNSLSNLFGVSDRLFENGQQINFHQLLIYFDIIIDSIEFFFQTFNSFVIIKSVYSILISKGIIIF